MRIAVPDEWYRRSRHRSLSASPYPSDTTSTLEEDLGDEEEEGEGTAKAAGKGRTTPTQTGVTTPLTRSPTKPQSAGRLSSIFDTWRSPVSSPSLDSQSANRRVSVSDPVPLMTAVQDAASQLEDEEDGAEAISSDFERMMDELGLKGPQRAQMNALPTDRKQYLIQQNRLHKSASSASLDQAPRQSASYGPASAAALLPKIVPQLTGDVVKRFSLAGLGWGSASTSSQQPSSSSPLSTSQSPGPKDTGVTTPALSTGDAVQEDVPEVAPLVPQSTGSRWSSWWGTASVENGKAPASADRTKPKTCAWYVDNLKPNILSGSKLAKHLISLRVHLSTAKLPWIQKFVREEKGMDVLGELLEDLVGKGSKRRKLPETDNMVLAEVMKCFRVLLNTEVRIRDRRRMFELSIAFSQALIAS